MKVLVLASTAVASVALVAGTAGGTTARADPDTVVEDGFLAALDNAGITHDGPLQAVAAGQAVCGLMDSGMSGIEVVNAVKKSNPGFTLDGAARFAAIAANEYCPQHLKPDVAQFGVQGGH